jgi:hypothetical protein
VSWYGPSSKWRALITVGGRTTWLGLYENEEDAARAYQRAAGSLGIEIKEHTSKYRGT